MFDARGQINPFIIFVALPALGAAIAAAWYERDRVAALGAAWCLGTFLPFVLQYTVFDRISYLYYMLLVMPGVYIVAARLFAPGRVPRAATIGWAVALVYGLANLYPVRSLTGKYVARVLVTRRLPGPALGGWPPRATRSTSGPSGCRRGPRSSAGARRTPRACSALLTDRVDAELLSAAPRLRAIANYAVGYDNVDLAATAARGDPGRQHARRADRRHG